MLLTTTNSCKMVVITTDDDSSTCSSTVGVLDVTNKLLLQLLDDDVDGAGAPPLANRMEDRHQQQQECKKTVRFNTNANQAYDNTQMINKQDCKRLWYSARDYKDFKAAKNMLVAQIARSEQRCSSCPLSLSYQDILYRTYEACCKYPLTHPVDEAHIIDETSIAFFGVTAAICTDPIVLEDQADEDQLRQWLDIATARLGLERSAVRGISRDRYYRYKDLVRNVLEIQTQLEEQEQGSCSDNSHQHHKATELYAARAEYLRQACQSITRPSRLFARQLARAQAATASPLW